MKLLVIAIAVVLGSIVIVSAMIGSWLLSVIASLLAIMILAFIIMSLLLEIEESEDQ